jgi:hypothetical protein
MYLLEKRTFQVCATWEDVDVYDSKAEAEAEATDLETRYRSWGPMAYETRITDLGD